MTYLPPHLRNVVRDLTIDHEGHYKCYSSDSSFYNGGNGFISESITKESMLALTKKYNAIIRSDLDSIYCSKKECINGSRWTIRGPNISRLFTTLANMFANGQMPYVQGIMFLPHGTSQRHLKIDLWSDNKDLENVKPIGQLIKTALEGCNFSARCISNSDWAEIEMSSKCATIAKLTPQDGLVVVGEKI